jgi:hypothetical protein
MTVYTLAADEEQTDDVNTFKGYNTELHLSKCAVCYSIKQRTNPTGKLKLP